MTETFEEPSEVDVASSGTEPFAQPDFLTPPADASGTAPLDAPSDGNVGDTPLVNPDPLPVPDGFPTYTSETLTTPNPGVPLVQPDPIVDDRPLDHIVMGDGSVATALPADVTVIDPVEPSTLASGELRVTRHILHDGVDYAPGSTIDAADEQWDDKTVAQLTADGALEQGSEPAGFSTDAEPSLSAPETDTE
jgi:hypothetical protein